MTALIIFAILALSMLGAPIFSIMGSGALFAFWKSGIDSAAVIVEMMRLASLRH